VSRFHEEVGGRFGIGIYTCAPSAAVWLLWRTVVAMWECVCDACCWVGG